MAVDMEPGLMLRQPPACPDQLQLHLSNSKEKTICSFSLGIHEDSNINTKIWNQKQSDIMVTGS